MSVEKPKSSEVQPVSPPLEFTRAEGKGPDSKLTTVLKAAAQDQQQERPDQILAQLEGSRGLKKYEKSPEQVLAKKMFRDVMDAARQQFIEMHKSRDEQAKWLPQFVDIAQGYIGGLLKDPNFPGAQYLELGQKVYYGDYITEKDRAQKKGTCWVASVFKNLAGPYRIKIDLNDGAG